jgi:hypothetical protein
VPKGVSVKIKRSRTLEHTVQLALQSSTEGEVSVGFWDILKSSIRAKLEEQHSREFRERETVEYEVELRGDVSTKFLLVWTDIWRSGVVHFSELGKNRSLPFKFRERTELDVQPME